MVSDLDARMLSLNEEILAISKKREEEKNPENEECPDTFGAWAIMKKFILYALLSGSLISSLTVIKVYQSIMNKL